ncbi:phage portal protein [Thalassospira sp. UBA1131]|uniref:phage portal protein n=1 Tax=Thalassospira sp. UBA1131 TaxID=1947672 RepID=UPI0025EE1F0D|nr:phage portal protein [Thalassospira sp. UBA1131]
MGLMKFVRGLGRGGASGARSQTFDLSNMSGEDLKEFIRIGGGMDTASGVAITDARAMRVAAAWRCVNIIAGTIASMPTDIIRRESETVRRPAVGHPLRRVLTVKPNQWQTPAEYKRLMQGHVLMRGNAYSRIVRSGKDVIALLPMHPDRTRAEQNDDMTMRYRYTRPDGSFITLQQKDVFHLRGMSLDGVHGMSVLSNMREALGLSIQTETAGASMFKNGVLAGGAYKHPGQLSDKAYDRLKSSLDEKSGAKKTGEWLILEEGMDIASVVLSAQDAQFLETRDFQRYDIAMFFGVPPHMIGATDKQTSWGSGIEAQGIGFVTYTLSDWFSIWEQAIKRDLLPPEEWETVDFKFFPQGLLRGDTKARKEFYQSALQWGWMSPNEVREKEDMNPRDGGDIYYDPPNTAGNQNEDTGDDNSQASEDQRIQD